MRAPKHIVITGASSGIGAALALHYAKPGVVLHLNGRNPERMAQVAHACQARGAQAHVALIDVRDQKTLEEWLLRIQRDTPIDLLIANAGISGGSGGTSVLGEDPDQLRRILAVNIDGVINTVAPLLDPMVKRGHGQIALISSLAGFRGLPSAPAYSTSKAAVKAYGEALRGWVGKFGVEVSVVCPGYIATPMTSRNPFPMPFILKPEKAAAIIARGLARNRSRIAFPLALYLPVWLISCLSPVLTDPLFSRLPAKPAAPGE